MNEEIKCGELVIFTKDGWDRAKPVCEHKSIGVSQKLATVECMDCKALLNPVDWLVKHLKQINQWHQIAYDRQARAELLYEKVSKHIKYTCEYCHELNTVQLKRIEISETATKKRIEVLKNSDLEQV